MKYLTIKKIYYDQILNGEKKIEYRALSKANSSLLSKEHPYITFHYYRKNRIVCEIRSIKIGKTPQYLLKVCGLGETCIKISIGKVIEEFL